MISFESMFMADPDLEENGVDVPLADGVTIKLARWGNKRFNALFKKLIAPHRHLLRAQQEIPEAVMTDIMIRTMAHTIILGWSGVLYQGKPMEFSPENAATLLKASKVFQDRVTGMSQDIKTFQRSEVEDDKGNF